MHWLRFPSPARAVAGAVVAAGVLLAASRHGSGSLDAPKVKLYGAKNYYYLTSNGNYFLQSGPGAVRQIVMANLPGTSPSCLILYDSLVASGTVIGQICPSSTVPGYNITYDVQFTTGLSATMFGGTAVGTTVTWDSSP